MDFHKEDNDIIRSSRAQMLLKRDVLKKLAIFTGKRLSLFNKATGLQACNFIQKRLPDRCFPVYILHNI